MSAGKTVRNEVLSKNSLNNIGEFPYLEILPDYFGPIRAEIAVLVYGKFIQLSTVSEMWTFDSVFAVLSPYLFQFWQFIHPEGQFFQFIIRQVQLQ